MPDNPSPFKPKQEPRMELRLLVAFLVMGAVLYLTPLIYKRYAAPAAPVKPAPAAQEAAQTAPKVPPVEDTAAEAAEPAKPAAQVSAPSQQTYTVDTDLYRIVFSNEGANVRSWVLKKYADAAGKPLELVAPGSAQSAYPFSLAFPGQKPRADLNKALFVLKTLPDGIEYEYSDGDIYARKTVRFERNGYLSQVSTEVTQGGKPVPHLIEWRGGFGDQAIQNAAGQQRTLFYDLSSSKLITKDPKAAKDGPVTDSGSYSFAGLEDNYFAAVFLPSANGHVFEIRTVADNVPAATDKTPQPHVGAEVGGAGLNQFAMYVGPKDLDILKKIDPRLEQLVDFGFWSWIAKPLFIVLNWLNDNFVHNYGWAIVLVTVLLNFVILPLRLSSMKSMKRMQNLKPQIDAINAKYKNVGLRDPKKADQNAEIMDLYKRHGVNPMGGCLPMVLQIPVFFAFYKVLTVSIEMRGAHWLWVTDLSQPETIPIRILPLVMIVAQFVMQKMTPTPSADPNQQRMMMFLPVVFGVMFYGASSGLVLYWLTSNLVGIVQQYFINKGIGTPAAATAGAAAAVPAAGKKRSGSRK